MPRLSLSQIFVVGFSLLFSLLVVGEESQVFNYPVSADNKSLRFSNTINKLAASNRVRSQFIQSKQVKILKRPLVSKGHMIYAKKAGLYWQVETPFLSEIIVTADRIVHSDGESTTIIDVASNPVAFGFSQIFFQLLTNNFEQLSENFNLYYFHCDQLNNNFSQYKGCCDEGSHSWKIGLLPKDPQVKRIISAVVLSGSQDIETITMSDHSGDKTHIKFSSRVLGGEELSDQELEKFAP